ncbi:MAG: exonuclease domain-containing protein [Woeseiaceae bacterium]
MPTFYYRDHFNELRDFVQTHYAHVLGSVNLSALRAFDELPQDAQCLFVRLLNRKGTMFDIRKLKYPELGDIDASFCDLHDAGFVRPVGERDYERLLHTLSKPQLLRFAAHPAIKQAWRKADCVAFALEHVPALPVIEKAKRRGFVVAARCDTFDFLQYLYFGRLFDGASQITLRDLGIVKEQGAFGYEPRFSTALEAETAFFYACERRRIRSGLRTEIDAVFARMPSWPEPDTPSAVIARDKLALRLGRIAEERKQTERAIVSYRKGDSVDCLRSAVRLLVSKKRHSEARVCLEEQIVSPGSDDAQCYAIDTLESRFGQKRRSDLRTELIDADVLQLDAYWRGSPERAAIDHFNGSGRQAFRTENQLWRVLFGVLFWDLLFEGEYAKTHSPFEGLPTHLSEKTFYAQHRDEIEKRLTMNGGARKTLQRLLKTITGNFGKFNGVFRWRRNSVPALTALLTHADPLVIANVLRPMCQDYAAHKTGYPDLMLVDNASVVFVEIKAPGDQLRRHQLRCIDRLRTAGFPTEVIRIEWVANPDQCYVVVDVETTGGRAGNHRVTEIGAVKVCNGVVIDRFSTLLNPMRTIPPHITRLTGISNSMVADAPLFSEVAEAFSEFLAGGIFVAHNVNFDYSFIKAEFERIGQRFRYPKLCTCASMRRQFKGHASYSLKALCREYDIPLETHHRALCDAEAAAGLLALLDLTG